MNNQLKEKLKKVLKPVLKVLICTLIVAVIYFAGFFTHYFSIDKQTRSLNFFLKQYKENYYYAQDDFMQALSEGVLDQYSGYYTKEEYQEYLKDGQGEHTGYGISISNLKVVRVVGNSPAEKAGILEGGIITGYKTTESQFITPESNAQLQEYLSTLTTSDQLTLQIDYNGQVKECTLKKDTYIQNYVFYTDSTGSYRFEGDSNLELKKYEGEDLNLGEDWGYLKFTSFNGLKGGNNGGAGQFKSAINLFKQNGKSKIIIDLRSNGGGYMSILCDICEILCDSNTNSNFTCAKACYKDGKTSVFNAGKSSYDNYGFTKIVFLANQNSASASEALMGAVLDYDKQSGNNIVRVLLDPSTLNGQTVYKTYGKGIMQSTFVNGLSGEAIKLTTATVNWPISGTCIHGIGITPDLDSRVFANTFGDAIYYAQTL